MSRSVDQLPSYRSPPRNRPRVSIYRERYVEKEHAHGICHVWYSYNMLVKVFIFALLLLLVDAKSSSISWHAEGSDSNSNTPEDADTSESDSESVSSVRSSSQTNPDTESGPSSSSSSDIDEWEICCFIADPQVNSTDGRSFKIRDVCIYDAAILIGGGLTIQVETYRRNVIDTKRNVSLVQRIIIIIDEGSSTIIIVITSKTVSVEDDVKKLPYEDKYIQCWRMQYQLYCMLKKFPVAVSTNLKWNFYIHFGDPLELKVKGICGNFNGSPDDDFTTREGVDVSNLPNGEQMFISSWKTTGCS